MNIKASKVIIIANNALVNLQFATMELLKGKHLSTYVVVVGHVYQIVWKFFGLNTLK